MPNPVNNPTSAVHAPLHVRHEVKEASANIITMPGGEKLQTLEVRAEIDTDNKRGIIKGYANTKNVWDSYNDKCVDGCYAWAVERFEKQGKDGNPNWIKFLHQHNWDEPLGLPIHMEEDSTGLLFEGKVVAPDEGLGKRVLLLADEGVLDAFSIGFRLKKSDYRWVDLEALSPEEIAALPADPFWWSPRELLNLRIYENSLVTFPANDTSRVTEVIKSIDRHLATTSVGWRASVEKGRKQISIPLPDPALVAEMVNEALEKRLAAVGLALAAPEPALASKAERPAPAPESKGEKTNPEGGSAPAPAQAPPSSSVLPEGLTELMREWWADAVEAGRPNDDLIRELRHQRLTRTRAPHTAELFQRAIDARCQEDGLSRAAALAEIAGESGLSVAQIHAASIGQGLEQTPTTVLEKALNATEVELLAALEADGFFADCADASDAAVPVGEAKAEATPPATPTTVNVVEAKPDPEGNATFRALLKEARNRIGSSSTAS